MSTTTNIHGASKILVEHKNGEHCSWHEISFVDDDGSVIHSIISFDEKAYQSTRIEYMG